MASTNVEKKCSKCSKSSAQIFCAGCEQWLCFTHLDEHRQELSRRFDNLIGQYNEFQEDLSVKTFVPDVFLQRIAAWERRSIERIEQIANSVRQELNECSLRKKQALQRSFDQIRENLREFDAEKNLSEIHLRQWADQLNDLRKNLNTVLNAKIFHDQNDSSRSIDLIQLDLANGEGKKKKTIVFFFILKIDLFNKLDHRKIWSKIGTTIVGNLSNSSALDQLYFPYGIDIDADGNLLIADCGNHRILRWKPNALQGELVFGGQGPGKGLNTLHHPLAVCVDRKMNRIFISDYGNRRILILNDRTTPPVEIFLSAIRSFGLAIDDQGAIYISDCDRNTVFRYRRGEKISTIVAGGNDKGNSLNQLNYPRNIFVDSQRTIYISDVRNHRVVKWMKDANEGVVVAGGQGQGSTRKQLNNPSGLFVDDIGSIFVVDQNNHRVMRWFPNATEGLVLIGDQSNQLFRPAGLFVDHNENLYVVDRDNHRIQHFSLEKNEVE